MADLVDDAVGNEPGSRAIPGDAVARPSLAHLFYGRPRSRARPGFCARSGFCTRACAVSVFRFRFLSSSGGAWFSRLDASRLSGARFSGDNLRMLPEPLLAHAAELALLPAPIPTLALLAGGGAGGVEQQRDHVVDGFAVIEQRGTDGELG